VLSKAVDSRIAITILANLTKVGSSSELVKEATAVQYHYAVREIPESGISIQDQCPPEWVDFVLGKLLKSQQKPALVELTLHREDENVLLDGFVKIAYKFVCSRCAEETSAQLNSKFCCVFVKDVGDEEEGELNTAGLTSERDIVSYTGSTIDLEQAMVEQIVLSLPAHPLCRETCKGLCDQCGQNMNLGNCRCLEEHVDPRWAKLQGIKLGD